MSSERARPNYGDEVFVPSEYEDGHWVNGIVNSVKEGQMLVAATGHRYSNLVLVSERAYLTEWCWPADVGQVGSGAKMSPLNEVEG